MSTIPIKQIIKDAGGPDAIAQASSKAGGDISKDAVYKWGKTGIRMRHWPVIIALTSYRPEQLLRRQCCGEGAAGRAAASGGGGMTSPSKAPVSSSQLATLPPGRDALQLGASCPCFSICLPMRTSVI